MNRSFPIVLLAVVVGFLLVPLSVNQARGGDALVAVAANFAEAAGELVRLFEAKTPHRLTMTTGSTGKLYAQISNGAPFDMLLAADQARPERLQRDGAIIAGSRFTYAVGRLVLWSPNEDGAAAGGRKRLQSGTFRALAIANPDLAPYGLAARQTLRSLGLWNSLEGKLVMGQNIGQAHALVVTGNAELGLVALSMVLSRRNSNAGNRWDIPGGLHDPIRQDAVVLKRAAGNAAALAFAEFLQSGEARAVIGRYGYAVE